MTPVTEQGVLLSATRHAIQPAREKVCLFACSLFNKSENAWREPASGQSLRALWAWPPAQDVASARARARPASAFTGAVLAGPRDAGERRTYIYLADGDTEAPWLPLCPRPPASRCLSGRPSQRHLGLVAVGLRLRPLLSLPLGSIALVLCPWFSCSWPAGGFLPGMSLLRHL